MALGDPYATSVQLKAYLNINDTVDDTAITDAVNSASREIDKYCGRQFNDAGSATARVFYADGWYLTRVDDFSTTTGLIVATDDGNDGTYGTTWAATDYQLEPLNGVADGEPGWPYWKVRSILARVFPTWTWRAPVKVTARWGWAAVPSPVKQACLIMAAQNFRLKDAPLGVAGFGEFGVVRVRDVPTAERMLGRYRRDPVKVA